MLTRNPIQHRIVKLLSLEGKKNWVRNEFRNISFYFFFWEEFCRIAINYLNVWYNSAVKPSHPGVILDGKNFVIVLILLLIIGLFSLFISTWFGHSKVYMLRNLWFLLDFPIFLHIFVHNSYMILYISVISVGMFLFVCLILVIWSFSLFHSLAKSIYICLFFQKNICFIDDCNFLVYFIYLFLIFFFYLFWVSIVLLVPWGLMSRCLFEAFFYRSIYYYRCPSSNCFCRTP